MPSKAARFSAPGGKGSRGPDGREATGADGALAPSRGRSRAAQQPRRRYTLGTMNVIVLPTYNERENLRHALARIREVADGHGVQLHTLIVDDDSPDGTGELADELAARGRRRLRAPPRRQGGPGQGLRRRLSRGARHGRRAHLRDGRRPQPRRQLPAALPAPHRPGRRPRARVALHQGRRRRELGAVAQGHQPRRLPLCADHPRPPAPRSHGRLQVLPPPRARDHRPRRHRHRRLRLPDRDDLPCVQAGLQGRGAAHHLRRSQGRREQDEQRHRARGHDRRLEAPLQQGVGAAAARP